MSTLLQLTRLTLARMSPINQLSRYLLSKKRQNSLKRVVKERLYTLQIQEEKLSKQLNNLNLIWKKSQTSIDTQIQKIKARIGKNQQTEITDKNFIQFVETLEITQDIDIKIKAISDVVTKIDGIELQKTGQQIKHNIMAISNYRGVLDTYLNKLQIEINYWKTQNNLELIKSEIESVNTN